MKDRQKFTRFLRKHIEISLILTYIFDTLIAAFCGFLIFDESKRNHLFAIFLTVLIGAELIYATKLIFSRIGMAVEMSENLHDLLLIAQKVYPGIIEDDIPSIFKINNAHFCPKCGTQYSPGYKCPSCGYKEMKVKE
jgi:hypothetical protein